MKLTKREKDGIETLVKLANTDPKIQGLIRARIENILMGSTPTKEAALQTLNEKIEYALYEYLLATGGKHARVICNGESKNLNVRNEKFIKFDAAISIDGEGA